MNKSDLKKKLIPIFRPNYTNEEVNFLSKVLKSGWIGLGPKTEEFEKGRIKERALQEEILQLEEESLPSLVDVKEKMISLEELKSKLKIK